MAGSNSLERILYIDRELRADRSPSLRALTRQFEVSEKTIRRDIEYMRDRLEAPVVFDRGTGGYRYSQSGFMLPAVHATEAEALEIAFLRYLTGGWRNTPLTEILATTWQKLARILPDTVSIDPALVDDHVLIIDRTIQVDPDIWYTVLKAVRSRVAITITHTAAKKRAKRQRTIHPYRMIHHLGAWYVIAWEPAIDDLRVFAISRIQAVTTVTRTTFSIPKDFNPDDYIDAQLGVFRGGDWMHVVLTARPEVANIVAERLPGRNQVTSFDPDGSLQAEFDVREQEEMVHWVLQWGATVVVHQPFSFRDEIKRRLYSTHKLYQ